MSNENLVQFGFNFRENDGDNAPHDDYVCLSLDGNKLFSSSPQASSDINNDISRHDNSNSCRKTCVHGSNKLTCVPMF